MLMILSNFKYGIYHERTLNDIFHIIDKSDMHKNNNFWVSAVCCLPLSFPNEMEATFVLEYYGKMLHVKPKYSLA
jgi:hypothetical protein